MEVQNLKTPLSALVQNQIHLNPAFQQYHLATSYLLHEAHLDQQLHVEAEPV